MRYYIAAITGLILTAAATSQAVERKEAKPVVCSAYTIAATADGGKLGVCAPTREGGKPRYLRSFVEAKVVNPDTAKPVTVLLGFQ